MTINTKFNIGQKVRRVGTNDVGVVTEISVSVDADCTPIISYEVHHAAADNLHVGTNFGGDGYEAEFHEYESQR